MTSGKVKSERQKVQRANTKNNRLTFLLKNATIREQNLRKVLVTVNKTIKKLKVVSTAQTQEWTYTGPTPAELDNLTTIITNALKNEETK